MKTIDDTLYFKHLKDFRSAQLLAVVGELPTHQQVFLQDLLKMEWSEYVDELFCRSFGGVK